MAVEWRVVPAMPCRIRQLKSARPIVAFYEDAEYERLVEVQRAISDDGSVTLPKGGKPRVVPTTLRLRDALAEHRHLRGDRVLYQDDGQRAVKWWLKWLLDRYMHLSSAAPREGIAA